MPKSSYATSSLKRITIGGAASSPTLVCELETGTFPGVPNAARGSSGRAKNPTRVHGLAAQSRKGLRRVGPGGLEPLTSSVSTYHAYKREGLRSYRAYSLHVLYTFHR